MTGFLLNMINRHQGTVEKVQPRIRSMYEPEPASSVATDTAFTSKANEIVKESLNTGVDMQFAFSKSSNLEKSTPENPPLAPLSDMLQQPARPDEGFRVSELNSLDKNRMDLMNELIQKQSFFSKSPDDEKSTKSTPENPPLAPLSDMLQQPARPDEGFRIPELNSRGKNHMDSMSEQMQSVLERLGQKSELSESFNKPNGLQNSVSSGASDQATSKIVSNETWLTNSIEETLRRLTSQINNVAEGKRGLQDHAHTLPANAMKTEADPVKILPAQPEAKGKRNGEQLIKSINDQKQPDTAPITSQSGFLQTPPWLTAMQAELNNRWRELNTQSQAEPVVNVTIGRVEIRAVNAEPVKPSQVQAKPTGVLSLDDYLKQRENKGRA